MTRSNAAVASFSKNSPGDRVVLEMSNVTILFNVGAKVDRAGLQPCCAGSSCVLLLSVGRSR